MEPTVVFVRTRDGLRPGTARLPGHRFDWLHLYYVPGTGGNTPLLVTALAAPLSRAGWAFKAVLRGARPARACYATPSEVFGSRYATDAWLAALRSESRQAWLADPDTGRQIADHTAWYVTYHKEQGKPWVLEAWPPGRDTALPLAPNVATHQHFWNSVASDVDLSRV